MIAAQKAVSAVEAAKTHPAGAYTRLWYRTRSDGEALWAEVKNPGHRPGLLPRKKPLGAAAPKPPLAIPPRPQAEASWLFPVKPLVKRDQGIMVVDDSTLDKPYAQRMDLVTDHWSGKHNRVVRGINLISLLWTDGEARLPCDFRIYNKKKDGLTKNDHFREMLR